jgi:glycosyltransferase involved in cell wall biosynthesis
VLFAGRLSLEKGVRLLPALAAGIAPVPLLVAGGGPLEGWLAGATALAPNLRPLGHRGAEEVRALVRDAAVVIVPSLFYETYCYAAAEALLDGRPVVASRIGAIPELVEHEVTGLLVPPGDATALTAAVSRALTDPAAARWGEAGRARILAAGDPARHLESLVAVYREAMAG